MSQVIINVSTPNDGLGDPLRDAFVKTNDNFTELYNKFNIWSGITNGTSGSAGTSGKAGTSGTSGKSGTSGTSSTSGSSGILPGVGNNREIVFRDVYSTYGYDTNSGLTYSGGTLKISGSGTLLDIIDSNSNSLFVVDDSNDGENIITIFNDSGDTIFNVQNNGDVILNGNFYVNTSLSTGLTIGTYIGYTLLKSSGRAAFIDYYILSGNTMRAGNIISIWDDLGNVSFTEYSTIDLGDTTNVLLSIDISGMFVRFIINILAGTWNVKTAIRII